MIGYFIGFLVVLFVGIYVVEYFRQRRKGGGEPVEEAVCDTLPEQAEPSIGCCGKHDSCELDEREQSFLPTIEYYDDEELDVFSGRPADSYTAEEISLFEEVLRTMQPEEVKAWLFSLRLREIALPPSLAREIA